MYPRIAAQLTKNKEQNSPTTSEEQRETSISSIPQNQTDEAKNAMDKMRTIDFSSFMVEEGAIIGEPSTPAQIEAAGEIDAAFRDNGFLFLDNIGITTDELDRYYEMSAMLFALPDEEKMTKLKQINVETNAGYSGLGREHLNSTRSADLKEVRSLFSSHTPPSSHLGPML